jgi:hypothetical protein
VRILPNVAATFVARKKNLCGKNGYKKSNTSFMAQSFFVRFAPQNNGMARKQNNTLKVTTNI